jgi:hypothetical protein
MTLIDRMKPAVPRRALFVLGGLVWGAAGVMLAWRGWETLAGAGLPGWVAVASGVVLGLVFFRLLFRRIADRVIGRIRSLPHERPCLFSFLDWRGYAMMAIMISTGVFLRTSGAVPSPVLGTLYVTMSVALLVSSVQLASVGVRG